MRWVGMADQCAAYAVLCGGTGQPLGRGFHERTCSKGPQRSWIVPTETVVSHRPIADLGVDDAQSLARVLDDQTELETGRNGVDVQHG